jgi:hypothetical protein
MITAADQAGRLQPTHRAHTLKKVSIIKTTTAETLINKVSKK